MSVENIQIGIEIIGTDTIKKATEALVALDIELKKKPKHFETLRTAMSGSSKELKITSNMFKETKRPISEITEELNRNKKGMTGTVTELEAMREAEKQAKNEFKLFMGETKVGTGNLIALKTAFRTVQEKGWGLDMTFKALQQKSVEFSGGIGLTRIQLMNVNAVMKRNSEAGATLAARYTQLNTRLAQTTEVTREFTGTLGPAGTALFKFTQQIFWTALGAMFVTMSFARLRRTIHAIERSTISLGKAYRSLRKAEKEAIEVRREYGATSEESIAAQERLLDANERVKMSEEAVRNAVEQRMLATLMLIFGTFPTMLRLGAEVFKVTLLIALASAQDAINKDKQTAASVKLAGAMVPELAGKTALLGVEAARLAVLKAFLAATGVGLILVAISAATMAYAASETERMIRETKELSQEIGNLPMKHGSPLEIKTKFGGWVEVPEILETPRIGAGISSTKIDNVNIRFGDLYIKEEADIYKIRSSLEDLFRKGISRRGGSFSR